MLKRLDIEQFIWLQEFNKHDKEPGKYIKQWKGVKPKTGAPYTCDVGYERFLGPEVCYHCLYVYAFVLCYYLLMDDNVEIVCVFTGLL